MYELMPNGALLSTLTALRLWPASLVLLALIVGT